MLAAFVLTLPIEDYLPYLPADGNMIAYGLVVLILMEQLFLLRITIMKMWSIPLRLALCWTWFPFLSRCANCWYCIRFF